MTLEPNEQEQLRAIRRSTPIGRMHDDIVYGHNRIEPCPYGCDDEVYVADDTHDGVCPTCDRLCTFDPPDE